MSSGAGTQTQGGQTKIYTPAGTPSHPGVSKPRRGSCEAWRAWQDCWEEGLTQRGTERRRAQVGGNASLDPQLLRHSRCRDSVAGPPGSISGASDSSTSLGATAQQRHWAITHNPLVTHSSPHPAPQHITHSHSVPREWPRGASRSGRFPPSLH